MKTALYYSLIIAMLALAISHQNARAGTTYYISVPVSGMAGDALDSGLADPIVMDSDDPGAAVIQGVFTHFVTYAGIAGEFDPVDGEYYYSDHTVKSVFGWHFTNDAGYYEVYANWRAYTNRTTQATYTTQTATGDVKVVVNQQENGGSYQLLGTYQLNANTLVTLSNKNLTDGGSGRASADAIKLVEVSGP